MEKFSAAAFYEIAATLQEMRHADETETKIATDSSLAEEFLPRLEKLCAGIGLRLSEKAIVKMRRSLASENGLVVHDFQIWIPELHRRITDEMEEKLFLYIPSDRAALYGQTAPFGNDVSIKFPTIEFDVVEAGNCYACGRGTAVVFHLMRVMEVGVQEFGKKLGVPLVNEKVWQVILNETEKAVKLLPRGPQIVEMNQALAMLHAVKLAWRNEVMHPKDTYTLEEADNLIRQVRIFMEQLAKIV
jgi:hypothetical protein